MNSNLKPLPLTADEIKKSIGQEVWCVPFGNSIRRGFGGDYNSLKNQIVSDVITKCGSKNFTLKDKGIYKLSNYYNDNNYGYRPFKTLQDALDYIECEEANIFLKNINANILSADDIRKIKEIVEIAKQRNK